MPPEPRKFLIVTADDFGLDSSINEAVAQAAAAGVLTAASLMVGAPAAAEAVSLARTLPHLRVGLHLVIADGWPVLPRHEIPDLLDADGRFGDHMLRDAVRFVCSPAVRHQMAAEIRAQFATFQRTGLPLDHVNAHKHFHLHPGLLGLILRIGREFGVSAIRVPGEPAWLASRAGPASLAGRLFLAPWLTLMKQRLRSHGITYNDQVFGIACSGHLDEPTLLEILARMPTGASEIYLHPATGAHHPITQSMSGYRHSDELAALLSERVRAAVRATGAVCGGYSDLSRHRLPASSSPS